MTFDNVSTTSLVGGALTSPWWAPLLSNINVVLTTILTLLGIVLTVVKIVQAVRKSRDD